MPINFIFLINLKIILLSNYAPRNNFPINTIYIILGYE